MHLIGKLLLTLPSDRTVVAVYKLFVEYYQLKMYHVQLKCSPRKYILFSLLISSTIF